MRLKALRAARRAALTGICLLLLTTCGPEAGNEPSSLSTTLQLEPCRLTGTVLPSGVDAECGSLEVPADRSRPEGEQIELRLAVLPAISRSAEPDPLFLLAGGPGQAATEAFLPMLAALRPIRENRDLVMLDQRGTGNDRTFRCQDEEIDPTVELDLEVVREWVATCREQLEGDPRHYVTEVAIQDLEAVREALGYESINLYGGSYGTRVASIYMRRHPERIRAAILDGVVPASMAVGEEMGRDAQRAIDLLFSRCGKSNACSERFKDPAVQLETLLAELESSPVPLQIADPTSGEPAEILLTRDLTAGTLRGLTYSPETAALIPVLVDRALRGDFGPLAAQSLISTNQLAESMATAMMFSVLCAEDIPFYSWDGNHGYLGSELAERFLAICDEWSVPASPAESKQPTPSNVPTLLLSGELDPVTPPRWAEEAARSLPSSVHLVAPGMAHIVFPRGCIPQVAEAFIEQGDVIGLDSDCVADLVPPPFFLSFSGPTP